MAYGFFTVDDLNGIANELLGINNGGWLSGFASSPPPIGTAGYVVVPTYGQDAFYTADIPNASAVHVTGSNNLGISVGTASSLSGDFGWAYYNNAFIDVVDPGTTGDGLNGVNDLGIAVGYGRNADNQTISYTFDIATDAFTPVVISGATQVVAHGIDNAGDICGSDVVGTSTQGFVDVNGVVTQLTGPAGSVAAQALGMNNQGLVVGDYTDAAGITHGFIYDIASARYTAIDDPNAVGGTVVTGINDQNQLSGYCTLTPDQTDGFLATLQGTIQKVVAPVAGSVLALGPGAGGVAAGGSNAVTLYDPGAGNADLFANSGNDTLIAYAQGDTLVGGSGDDMFFTYGGDSVFLGSGRNTAVTYGADTVVASSGADTVYAAAGTEVFGGVAGSSMTAVATGAALMVDQGGDMTVFEGTAEYGEVFGGAGNTTYVGGSGDNAFVGGSGTATAYAGSGADLLWGGSGAETLVGGAEAATTIVTGLGPDTVYYSGGNAVFVNGPANDVASYYGPGGSDAAIVATGSSGSDVFVMGAGYAGLWLGSGASTTFLGSGGTDAFGGSGADVYVSVNGQSGGTDILNGFRPGTDLVQLTGYGAGEVQNDLANAQIIGGSTFVLLSDNTLLDFVGVTGLTAHSFVS